MKIIKNDNGKRIKDCWDCSKLYADYYFHGCIEGLENTNEYRSIVSYSGNIPIECRLPNWKRTLEVKRD